MHTVVADEVLRGRLGDMSRKIEIRDESGRLLGWFVPESESAEPLPFTEADLERVRREPGGKTLAEISRDLGRTHSPDRVVS